MEGPRAARKEELNDIIDLINGVFRSSRGIAPTMGEQFPLLLNEGNIENIYIMLDRSKPVSVASYYPSTIMVNTACIRAASIGAVCTSPEYRGRGFASEILDMAEDGMKRDNVDIMLVSGTSDLYLRRNCTIVGGFMKTVIKPEVARSYPIDLLKYSDVHFKYMAGIYEGESVKFQRQPDEFKSILKGATTPWNCYTYEVFLVQRHGEPVAYIVLKIIHNGSDWGEIVEYAGDRESIFEAFYRIAGDLSLTRIVVYSHNSDPINSCFKKNGIKSEAVNQLGTLKIVNYSAFMEKLKPYFADFSPADIMNAMTFAEHKDMCTLKVYDEAVQLESQELLCSMIFGSPENGSMAEILNKKLARLPKAAWFCRTALPIPFPWAGNINYI